MYYGSCDYGSRGNSRYVLFVGELRFEELWRTDRDVLIAAGVSAWSSLGEVERSRDDGDEDEREGWMDGWMICKQVLCLESE